MTLNPELQTALLSGFIGAATVGIFNLIIQIYVNKKNTENNKIQLDANKENLLLQLEQSEKNLRIQLLFDKQQKSIGKLFEIVTNINLNKKELETNIKDFLNSEEGYYLPLELQRNIRSHINTANVDMYALEVDLGMRRPDEDEYWQEQYEEYYAGLDAYERYELDYNSIVKALRRNLTDEIRKSMTTP